MTATERTEYGVRWPDGRDVWGDSDGEILVDGDYVDADLDDLRAALKGHPRARIISRTHSTSETVTVSAPLPTTPGSLVRATVAGERATYGLDGFAGGSETPFWTRLTLAANALDATPDTMTDVVVLFDAEGSEAL